MRIGKIIGLALFVSLSPFTFVAESSASGGLKKSLGGKTKRETSADKVNVTATVGKISPDGKQLVTVKIKIEEGWYIYANDPQNKKLNAARTEMKITGTGVQTVRMEFPKGELKPDGEYTCRVYKKSVTLKTTVQRSHDAVSPLQISIRVSACNATECLFPGTVKRTVK